LQPSRARSTRNPVRPAIRVNQHWGISTKANPELIFRATLQHVYAALVKLELEFPCSENRSKERDKRPFVWLTTKQGQRGALFARVAFSCLLLLAKQEK
jgi:hypothetical protein